MYRTLTIRNIKQNPTAIAAAVLCIGLITVLAGPWDRVANHATAIASSPKMLTILVASHVLPAGSEIGPDDFTVKQVMGLVPADAVSSGSEIIGRITAKQYAAKEVFSRESLRDPSTLGIAAHVRPGQRAFSIRIAEDEIVGGFLQSGDHVDVFATIPGSVFPTKDSADVPDRSSAVLLLQNIAVLAVGENPATRGSIQSSARTVSPVTIASQNQFPRCWPILCRSERTRVRPRPRSCAWPSHESANTRLAFRSLVARALVPSPLVAHDEKRACFETCCGDVCLARDSCG
jgi:Flp pilus assembly protein CpaB